MSNESNSERYFQTRFSFDSRRKRVWKEICRYLQRRYIPEAATVLDLGTGYGDFINQVRARARHAVDVHENLAEHVDPNVTFHAHSCTAMPAFREETFDVVFASNLFEHLTRGELLATLSEVARVLRPGGRLILLQPNFKYCAASYFDDYTHVQVFSHISLADLLVARGFEIMCVQGRFLPFSLKTRLPTNRLLVRAYLASPIKPLARQMLVVARKPLYPQR
ncbi:MAG: class I SAM-dependent methyltransferase [Acidobacteria bacterium]|nr:MAG: class I SAM-dependent methyltransferase [Acidobacteriota bacterium]